MFCAFQLVSRFANFLVCQWREMCGNTQGGNGVNRRQSTKAEVIHSLTNGGCHLLIHQCYFLASICCHINCGYFGPGKQIEAKIFLFQDLSVPSKWTSHSGVNNCVVWICTTHTKTKVVSRSLRPMGSETRKDRHASVLWSHDHFFPFDWHTATMMMTTRTIRGGNITFLAILHKAAPPRKPEAITNVHAASTFQLNDFGHQVHGHCGFTVTLLLPWYDVFSLRHSFNLGGFFWPGNKRWWNTEQR